MDLCGFKKIRNSRVVTLLVSYDTAERQFVLSLGRRRCILLQCLHTASDRVAH